MEQTILTIKEHYSFILTFLGLFYIRILDNSFDIKKMVPPVTIPIH